MKTKIIILSLVSAAVLVTALIKFHNRPSEFDVFNSKRAPSHRVVNTDHNISAEQSVSTATESNQQTEPEEERSRIASYNSGSIAHEADSEDESSDEVTAVAEASAPAAQNAGSVGGDQAFPAGDAGGGKAAGAQSGASGSGSSSGGGSGAASSGEASASGQADSHADIPATTVTSIIPTVESRPGADTTDNASATTYPDYTVLIETPDTSTIHFGYNGYPDASNAISGGVNNIFNLGYSDNEITLLTDLYVQGKAGQDPAPVVIDGKTWHYVDSTLGSYTYGDAWIQENTYYIKLGSGLEGGPVESGSNNPEPATIISALLGLAGFALRRFRKA